MSEELDPTQPGGTEIVNIAQNARMQAMAQVAQNAYAEVAPDLADIDEESGTIIPRTAPEPEPALQPQAESVTTPPEPPKKMVSLVVDGQTIEVEESRLIEAGRRTLQKESAADKKLQEAANLKRQYEHYLSNLSRPSSDAAPQQAPPQGVPQQATTGLDPAQLDSLLDNKLYVRDAQKAAVQFRKDYADIVSDPYLYDMAVQLENKRLAEATALGESFGDPFDAYRKHGEALREWKAKLTGAVAAPVDKLERKRTIAAVPGNNASPPKPAEEVEKTPSQIIDDMRKDRARGYTFRAPRNGHKYG